MKIGAWGVPQLLLSLLPFASLKKGVQGHSPAEAWGVPNCLTIYFSHPFPTKWGKGHK